VTEVTEEKAAEVLLEANRKKQEAFQRDYEKLCLKHGCRLVGVPGFTEDGRVGVQLHVRNMP
jgi:hypothetical protein